MRLPCACRGRARRREIARNATLRVFHWHQFASRGHQLALTRPRLAGARSGAAHSEAALGPSGAWRGAAPALRAGNAWRIYTRLTDARRPPICCHPRTPSARVQHACQLAAGAADGWSWLLPLPYIVTALGIKGAAAAGAAQALASCCSAHRRIAGAPRLPLLVRSLAACHAAAWSPDRLAAAAAAHARCPSRAAQEAATGSSRPAAGSPCSAVPCVRSADGCVRKLQQVCTV